MERLACSWCNAQNEPTATNCFQCGAPLDSSRRVTDSGWTEVPRLRDLAEFRFSNSVCQIDGEIVPVIEVGLAQGDGIFFDAHTLLWLQPGINLNSQPLAGGLKRLTAGMPAFITQAAGPGRLALSRDAMGEVVVLLMDPSHEIDVRSHAFLMANHTVNYSFVPTGGGMRQAIHGAGMYMDRFVTNGAPGLLVLHGYGNVFERTLAPGERLLIEPGGFLYKDSSVTMELRQQPVKTSAMHNGLYLQEMVGPGRVAVQSMYHHTEIR